MTRVASATTASSESPSGMTLMAIDVGPVEVPRAAERALELELAVLRQREVGEALGLLGRLGADEVHQAARGVAPVQRTLRPPQDFNPLQVHQLEGHPGQRADVDFVDIHGHRALVVVVEIRQADAAHGQRGVVALARRRAETEVGRLGDDVDRVDETELLDLPGGERRDGHAHVLQALFALLGGNRDLFQFRRLRLRRNGHGEEQGNRRRQSKVFHVHVALPHGCFIVSGTRLGTSCAPL